MQNDDSVANQIITLPGDLPAPASPARDVLAARLADYADAAQGAFAPATERARRGDLLAYVAWCDETGRDALPAEPSAIRAYIQHLDGLGRAPATIERALQSIAHLHKAAGVDPLPTRAQAVRLEMRRLKRRLAEAGERRGRGQAVPATFDAVRRMTAACEKAMAEADLAAPFGRRSYLAAIRDRALIAVAYASLLRRSELVALDVVDLRFSAQGQGAALQIRRSKTDQDGAGASVGIGRAATRLLRAYLDHVGHDSGPLLCSVNGRRLDVKEVTRVIKRRALEAGFDPGEVAKLSAHSTRIGATVDALSAGKTQEQAQRRGRWKGAAMVARYGRNVQAERDALDWEEAVDRLYGGHESNG